MLQAFVGRTCSFLTVCSHDPASGKHLIIATTLPAKRNVIRSVAFSLFSKKAICMGFGVLAQHVSKNNAK